MISLTHHQIRQHLEAAADTSLDPTARSAVDAHLAGCPACRAYADELARLQQDLTRALYARWERHVPGSASAALPRTLLTRSRRPEMRAWVPAASLAVVMVAVLAVWPWLRPPAPSLGQLPAAGLTALALPPVAVLGVHYVQPHESVRCIAAAYGVPATAIVAANNLGQPPQLRAGPLLIPDAPESGSAPPSGPSCAAQFLSPYAVDKSNVVKAPAMPVFVLESLAATSYGTCREAWIGGWVAGQAGAPLTGLRLRLEGNGVSLEAETGQAPYFGAGAYSFALPGSAAESEAGYTLQVWNTDGQPLSRAVAVTAAPGCGQNLTVVVFRQR